VGGGAISCEKKRDDLSRPGVEKKGAKGVAASNGEEISLTGRRRNFLWSVRKRPCRKRGEKKS